jgi:hypothetical protein
MLNHQIKVLIAFVFVARGKNRRLAGLNTYFLKEISQHERILYFKLISPYYPDRHSQQLAFDQSQRENPRLAFIAPFFNK